MIAFADLYPTLLSMMGFSKEIPETVQTFDLSNEVLTGKNKKDLVQPYYFVKFDNHATGYRGLRTDRYTYAVHATDGKIDNVILFDRTNDPHEMNNIASQQLKLTHTFNRQLKTWLEKTNHEQNQHHPTLTFLLSLLLGATGYYPRSQTLSVEMASSGNGSRIPL